MPEPAGATKGPLTIYGSSRVHAPQFVKALFSPKVRRFLNECVGRYARDWARIVMNEDTARFMATLDPASKHAIE